MVTWCTGTLPGYMGQGPRRPLPVQKLVTHPSTQIHSWPTPHRCQIMPGPHQIYARSMPDHTRSVLGPCQPVPGPHQIYTRSMPGPSGHVPTWAYIVECLAQLRGQAGGSYVLPALGR